MVGGFGIGLRWKKKGISYKKVWRVRIRFL
jgi:hypothetical protein